jgi:hypothetical protein
MQDMVSRPRMLKCTLNIDAQFISQIRTRERTGVQESSYEPESESERMK